MEFVSQLGSSTLDALSYLGSLTSLGARAAYYTLVAPFKGKPLRLQRAVSQAMNTGVRALPILSLITFFIGLILALQAAYELRRFGAISAVATAVAVSMSRELGPLITAIVVIGRSGSAFAAELGTMKVSEEIDALETMAISPIRFPRRPKVPGHDGHVAMPDHLGQRHGHSRRFVVRRRSSRFHIWALHPGFHRLFASAGYHDGIGEERDVWHHHHRRRLS